MGIDHPQNYKPFSGGGTKNKKECQVRTFAFTATRYDDVIPLVYNRKLRIHRCATQHTSPILISIKYQVFYAFSVGADAIDMSICEDLDIIFAQLQRKPGMT